MTLTRSSGQATWIFWSSRRALFRKFCIALPVEDRQRVAAELPVELRPGHVFRAVELEGHIVEPQVEVDPQRASPEGPEGPEVDGDGVGQEVLEKVVREPDLPLVDLLFPRVV